MNVLNETILNILRDFIPHETVLCDDTWIHRGLIIKLSSLYTKKILHLNGLEVIDITVA